MFASPTCVDQASRSLPQGLPDMALLTAAAASTANSARGLPLTGPASGFKRTRTRCRVVRQAKSPPSPPPLSVFYPSPPSPQTPPSSERGNEIQPAFCEARVVLGRVGSRSASAVGRRQSLARPGSDRGNSGFPMCKTGKTRCRVGWSSEVRREADKEEKVEKEKEEEEREDEEQEEQEVEVGGEVEEEDEEEDEEEGEKEEREEEDLVVDGVMVEQCPAKERSTGKVNLHAIHCVVEVDDYDDDDRVVEADFEVRGDDIYEEEDDEYDDDDDDDDYDDDEDENDDENEEEDNSDRDNDEEDFGKVGSRNHAPARLVASFQRLRARNRTIAQFQRLATVSRNCVFAGRLARVQEASTGSELSQLVVSPEGDTKYLAATATRMTGEGDGEDDEFVYSNLLTGKYQITFQGLYPLLLTLFMDTPKTLKTLPPSQSALPPGSISSMPR